MGQPVDDSARKEPAAASTAAVRPGNDGSAGPVRIGVLSERADTEQRVAMVPEVLAKLSRLGCELLIEAGAGAGANATDDDYRAAGAQVTDRAAVLAEADVLLRVGPLGDTAAALRSGQVALGLLRPWEDLAAVRAAADTSATLISLDYLPRTLSRAQVMDALTSQSSIAGYRAALRAADTYGGYFPMLMTAAGTVKPAEVLVLGAGVAGLQAIATARRLGASVWGYDVRPAAREEVASLGAKFVDLGSTVDAAGTGGYARELTAEEQAAQQAALDKFISRSDVVITTAQVPGRKPPTLVTASAVQHMKRGSVVLDMAASSYGGNVEGSVPDDTIVTDGGVTVIGAGSLASDMAPVSSTMLARNLVAALGLLVKDGAVQVDPADEVIGAMLVTHDGAVVHPKIAETLGAREGVAS